jgi:transcriptional regulator with XRE-family HTH domain
MPFGELLRRLRGSKTQKEVADDLKMPITTLSGLENQNAVPRGSVLKKLADYYGVPLTYFYTTPVSKMEPSDAARDWLLSLKHQEVKNSGIATQAPPEYPDSIKQEFAEKIRQKKRAEASDRK